MEKQEVKDSDVNTVLGERRSYYGFSVQDLNDIARDIGVKPHAGNPTLNPGETDGNMS